MPSSFLEPVSLICHSVNNPPFFCLVPSFPYLGHPHLHLSPSFDTQRELEGGVSGHLGSGVCTWLVSHLCVPVPGRCPRLLTRQGLHFALVSALGAIPAGVAGFAAEITEPTELNSHRAGHQCSPILHMVLPA